MNTTACSLPTGDRPLRLAEFDALFAQSVRRIERDGLHVRLHLAGDLQLRERVRDLAERESGCCSFFTFAIKGSESDLILEITVPRERADILSALADRAAELSA